MANHVEIIKTDVDDDDCVKFVTPHQVKEDEKIYPMKRYSCPECEFKTTNKQSFHRHVKSIHEGEVFPCKICEYKAKDKSYLIKHMQHVHDEKKNKCPKCDLVTNKINMKRHMKLVHEGVRQIFSCSQCEYTAKRKHTVNLHMRKIHEGQLIQHSCEHCEFKTKSLGNLWRIRKQFMRVTYSIANNVSTKLKVRELCGCIRKKFMKT